VKSFIHVYENSLHWSSLTTSAIVGGIWSASRGSSTGLVFEMTGRRKSFLSELRLGNYNRWIDVRPSLKIGETLSGVKAPSGTMW
jgi:hypothetical protein